MPRPSEDKWEPIDSLGTTGEIVARNVKRLRGNVPFTELSARLTDLGREIPTWGLRKIESGGRRVDVDDLVALAVALDVSPVSFLVPLDSSEQNDQIPVTAFKEGLTAKEAWEWMVADHTRRRSDDWMTFVQRAWPLWKVEPLFDAMRREVIRYHEMKELSDRIAEPPDMERKNGDD